MYNPTDVTTDDATTLRDTGASAPAGGDDLTTILIPGTPARGFLIPPPPGCPSWCAGEHSPIDVEHVSDHAMTGATADDDGVWVQLRQEPGGPVRVAVAVWSGDESAETELELAAAGGFSDMFRALLTAARSA